MSEAKLQLTRKQLAKFLDDDPDAIRVFERLLKVGDTFESVDPNDLKLAIYDSGIDFIRLVDGTMICWGFGVAISSGAVNGFGTISFSKSFANTSYFVIADQDTAAGITAFLSPIGYDTKTVSSCRVGFADSGGTVIPAGKTFAWYAIGKWNLSTQVIAPGTLVGTDAIFASYYGASCALTAGNLNRIQFNTRDEDAYNCVTTGVNWAFKAPAAGLYLVQAIVFGSNSSANTNAHMDLYVKGINTGPISANDLPTGFGFDQWGSEVVRLAKDDEIYLAGEFTTGAAITIGSGKVKITRVGL